MHRAFGVKYSVLDDLKLVISPEFTSKEALEKFEPTLNMIYGKNFSEKSVLDPLLPFETNKQCLKSISTSRQKFKKKQKSSYFFRNVSRDHSKLTRMKNSAVAGPTEDLAKLDAANEKS
jgi:hypothetical protein